MWRFWTGAGGGRGVVGVICMATDELYLFVFRVLACVVVCDRRKEMKAKIIWLWTLIKAWAKYLYEMGSKKQAEWSLELEFREDGNEAAIFFHSTLHNLR